MRYHWFAACSAAALFAFGAGAATAATATDTASASDTAGTSASTDTSASTLGGIVVTARRSAESEQKVPEAVTAFSQQTLVAHQITSAGQLDKVVSGLNVFSQSGNPSQISFGIRGRGLNYGAAAGSVETYFADVPLSSPFNEPGLPPQFFDLQSFQVLKGPQGTLFGRSTTGGAVLIVPQAPTNNFGGYVRLQGGTYNDFQFEGAINIPIVADKVLLRIADFNWQRKGYMHTFGTAFVANAAGTAFINTGAPQVNSLTGLPLGSQTFNSYNQNEFRATLLVRPSDRLTNTTIFTYHYDHNVFGSGAGIANIFTGASETFPREPGFGTLTTSSDIVSGTPSTNSWAAINTTQFDLTSDIYLKNIFGYVSAKGYIQQGLDADGGEAPGVSLGVFPYYPQANYQTTDEFQLHGSSFEHRLTWLVGGLADFTQEATDPAHINPNSPTYQGSGCGFPAAGVNPYFGVNAVGQHNGSCGILGVFTGNVVTSYAAYVSGSFKITDQLTVSGGYRHSWNRIEEVNGAAAALINPVTGTFPAGPALCCAAPGLSNFSTQGPGDSYDASLQYQLAPQVMLYGGYRRGFKHGGFNQSALNSGLQSFQSETVDDFYVGMKSQFHVGDIPARFNIEGYWDNYKDQQVSYLSQVATGQLTTVTVNVPKSLYRGFDVDFAADPTSWMTIEGGWSYLDAENTSWPDQSCTVVVCHELAPPFAAVPQAAQDLTANPAPYASRNKFNATVRFHMELPNDRGEIAFAPTVSFQSHWFTAPTAVVFPQAQQLIFGNVNMTSFGGAFVPAWTLLDLRLEWNRIWGTQVNGALNVTNVTNKVYITGNGATAEVFNAGQDDAYGPPMMINFELSTKF
jgi:iron complex outermembrane receptor protein